jgi:DNA-binding protein HU-beta
VNKSDLIEIVSARLGDRRAASAAVEAVVDAITRSVAKGEKVGISGFGVFERVDRAARTARNPTTGEAVMLGETRVPKFRPGQGFKDIVSGAKEVSEVYGERAVTARAGIPRAPRAASSRPAPSARGAGARPAKTAQAAAKAPARTAAKAPARTAAKAAVTAAGAKAAGAKATAGRTVAAPGARSAAAAKAPGRAAAAKAPAAKAAPAKRTPR